MKNTEEIDISGSDEQITIDLDHSTANKDLVTGDGQIIFPNIPESNEQAEEPEADEEFNVNSGESNSVLNPLSSIRPRARPEKGFDSTMTHLLADIKNKRFNQSRGFYSYHTAGSRIKDANQLDRNIRGGVVNSARRSRQYASGMMTSILKLAADRLDEKYPNSPLCINDLSSRNGGKLGGHGSHRNGLDADVSYPSTANECKGSFFHSWSTLVKKDSKFMERNWFFINTLLDTERVHVLFVSRHFAKSLCTYVKTHTNMSRTNRNKIFKKLHHISGHHHHYHIRLQCNRQNAGCITQGQLTGLTCN